ncbi:MAG: haloacid dehalogenase type II [Alphaproteobacteria bacterium]|nr:haloacid dehalogenase type II [Alphaproteobacteria bacterium]
MTLARFKAFAFDCYGTLIDWETGLQAWLGAWAARRGVARDADTLVSTFAAAQRPLQAVRPAMLYRDLLAEALRRMASGCGVPCPEEDARAFGDSIKDWPAFPDSRAALARLKRGHRLLVLSNVDRESFAHSDETLDRIFDAVVTAEDVGAYKPDARMFEALLDRLARLGVARDEVLHVAQSRFHDIAPAGRLGLATCWIDRRTGKAGRGAAVAPEGPPPVADFTFRSLAELADAHDAGA